MSETTDATPEELQAEIEELAAKLNAANERQQAETERADADRAARELAYRRERLAAYDPQTLEAAVRRCDRELREALPSDTAFGAVMRAVAAQAAMQRGRVLAAADADAVAVAEGREPSQQFIGEGHIDLPEVLLQRVLDAVTRGVVEGEQAVEGERMAAAIFGTSDPAVVAAAEARVETLRRAEAARMTVASVPVERLTARDREELGLPPAGANKDPLRKRNMTDLL